MEKVETLRAIWLNCVGLIMMLLVSCYAGLVIFAFYYRERCDPLEIKVRIHL